jgi:hypothetical protein
MPGIDQQRREGKRQDRRGMDPCLDGGELRPARENKCRHHGDFQGRHAFGGSHCTEEQADGHGGHGDGRNVTQARSNFAAIADGEGICLIHNHALFPGLMRA